MSDIAPPRTLSECAQIAYDAVMRRTGDDTELADIIRRGIYDAYRTGWNRALEGGAQGIESVDRAEWALAGIHAGDDAARILRSYKKREGTSDV
ncbi:hypothetical protein [Nocardiopsis sp. NPDC058789]|uniref:hypothetical protein n=1 Tax=Nocardiopsis sp. NPDC058789 TaxID=3346634 RepID=UPI003671ECC3